MRKALLLLGILCGFLGLVPAQAGAVADSWSDSTWAPPYSYLGRVAYGHGDANNDLHEDIVRVNFTHNAGGANCSNGQHRVVIDTKLSGAGSGAGFSGWQSILSTCRTMASSPEDILIGHFNSNVGFDVLFYDSSGPDTFLSYNVAGVAVWNYDPNAPGVSGYEGGRVADIQGDGLDDILWVDLNGAMQEVVYQTGSNSTNGYSVSAAYYWAQISGSQWVILPYWTSVPGAKCGANGQAFAVANKTNASQRYTYWLGTCGGSWSTATSVGMSYLGNLTSDTRFVTQFLGSPWNYNSDYAVTYVQDRDIYSNVVYLRFNHSSAINIGATTVSPMYVPNDIYGDVPVSPSSSLH